MADRDKHALVDINLKGESVSPVGSRYGLPEMMVIFHKHAHLENMLLVEATVSHEISKLYPHLVPPEAAREISRKATLEFVKPERVAEIEAVRHHDVLSMIKALEEQCEGNAGDFIHLTMTSADATETARAVQLKKGLEVLIRSVDDACTLALRKAQEWQDIITVQVTHNQDALPEPLGRALAHYGETLHHHAHRLRYDLDQCVFGKISGATGNYHPSKSVGVEGPLLERKVCDALGIKSTVAASQVPAREHLAFIISDIALLGRTLENMAWWIWELKSTAKSELFEPTESGQKGSSTMPHKTLRGGNPFAEERIASIAIDLAGRAAAMSESVVMNYARDLRASLNDRITVPEVFILSHYAVNLVINKLNRLVPDQEGVTKARERTFGILCAERVMTMLAGKGMNRDDAHTLTGQLATKAYESKVPFAEILKAEKAITDFLSLQEIDEATNLENYIGLSREIIRRLGEQISQA